jgi:hypothetical protein
VLARLDAYPPDLQQDEIGLYRARLCRSRPREASSRRAKGESALTFFFVDFHARYSTLETSESFSPLCSLAWTHIRRICSRTKSASLTHHVYAGLDPVKRAVGEPKANRLSLFFSSTFTLAHLAKELFERAR